MFADMAHTMVQHRCQRVGFRLVAGAERPVLLSVAGVGWWRNKHTRRGVGRRYLNRLSRPEPGPALNKISHGTRR
jgi:hypothetical protein